MSEESTPTKFNRHPLDGERLSRFARRKRTRTIEPSRIFLLAARHATVPGQPGVDLTHDGECDAFRRYGSDSDADWTVKPGFKPFGGRPQFFEEPIAARRRAQ